MKRLIVGTQSTEGKEYIECMAFIGTGKPKGKHAFSVYVNPDDNREGTVYFKYCNNSGYKNCSEFIRIQLDECKYVLHTNDDGKGLWKINSQDKKLLCRFLSSRSAQLPKYTNYQMCCYEWNYEMHLFDGIKWQYRDKECQSMAEAYFEGQFDSKDCAQHPSYVPSTLKMPNYKNLPTLK